MVLEVCFLSFFEHGPGHTRFRQHVRNESIRRIEPELRDWLREQASQHRVSVEELR
jgi:hypothetical protein